MGDPPVDEVCGRLRAAGVPITSSLPSLVEMLIYEGADSGEDTGRLILTLAGAVALLGGDVWETLESVSSGIVRHGFRGYVERLLEAHFAPQVEIVQGIQRSKAALSEVHTDMLNEVSTLLATLTGSPSAAAPGPAASMPRPLVFSGPAADALTAQFATIEADVKAQAGALETSQAVDADLYTRLYQMQRDSLSMDPFDLVQMGAALVLAPPTDAASLRMESEGGLLTAEMEANLTGITACFTIWAMDHELLGIATFQVKPYES